MPAASTSIVSPLTALLEPTSFQAQMMLACGFGVLAWVLFRRTIQAKKRGRIAAAQWKRQKQETDRRNGTSMPLADAPVEVLRWQGAMFDLQRELKAELETKISVLQAMVQLADQRIATLRSLHAGGASNPAAAASAEQAQQLWAEGRTAAQIAAALRIPMDEVETLLRTES